MITPLRDRVIIKPDEETEEVAKGGILVARASVLKPVNRGVVELVGTAVKEVKKGDKVIYSPYHYEEFDEGRIIVAEEDVWAIVK